MSEIGASSNEYTLSYASAPSREPVKFALHDLRESFPEEVAFSNSLLPYLQCIIYILFIERNWRSVALRVNPSCHTEPDFSKGL